MLENGAEIRQGSVPVSDSEEKTTMKHLPEMPHGLKGSIIKLLALGICMTKSSSKILHDSSMYVSSTISKLKHDGLVIENRSKGILRLSSRGVLLLEQNDPALFEFYMRYSNDNHPGCTDRHIDTQARASEVLALVSMAGVAVGTDKPNLYEMATEQVAKLSLPEAAFFLNKEIRYSVEQKEGRAQLSRASGALVSVGFTGLVYNARGSTLNLSRIAELETNIRLVQLVQDAYSNAPFKDVTESLLVLPDFDAALLVLSQKPSDRRGRIKTIADAIYNKKLTGTSFRFVPYSGDGVQLLKTITRVSRHDILCSLFSSAERAAAKESGAGDAIIDGLICYEFISSNLTKAAYILSHHPQDTPLGIICYEQQSQFIKRAFANWCSLKLRVYRLDALVSNLNTERSLDSC